MTPQEAIERALELAGGDPCVAIVQERSAANVRWANNSLTTNGLARTRELAVVAAVEGDAGTSAGVVTRSDLTPDGVAEAVGAARAAARALGPAEDAGPLPAGDAAAGWDEPAGETSIRVLAPLAARLGELFKEAAAERRNLYGYAEHTVATTYLGTSGGLRRRHQQPGGVLELTGRSLDGERSAWAGRGTRDFTDVDVAATAGEVARRLEWARRRVELPAGRYETLLPPSAVGDLMIHVYYATRALDAYEGRTVFSRPGGGTRVGEQLAELPVTLRSDPALPGLACSPFLATTQSSRIASVFDNGLDLGPTDWVRDGVLHSLVQTRHSARVTGLPTTPWVDNLQLSAPDGERTMDDLVGSTERGLLLTCLWYIREVDPQTLLLTGLTRDGVFLVEGGEVVGAVNNFRFNDSPVDLLRRLREVGTPEPALPRELGEYFTRVSMPPVRVADFNMSSVSKAM